MADMYIPGPWRALHVTSGAYYTHHIEITDGHIASVVGWTTVGTVCPTSEANARLIEHPPEMAAALHDLIAWATLMGGWDAPCWERAQHVLDRATTNSAWSATP